MSFLPAKKYRKEEIVDFKVTEVENKDNLLNFFKISYVISVFLRCFFNFARNNNGNIFHIWAFPILFYTHWEIMFCSGFACCSYRKRACICCWGNKTWCVL